MAHKCPPLPFIYYIIFPGKQQLVESEPLFIDPCPTCFDPSEEDVHQVRFSKPKLRANAMWGGISMLTVQNTIAQAPVSTKGVRFMESSKEDEKRSMAWGMQKENYKGDGGGGIRNALYCVG
jgi:hypothetical protein